jgi:hypothetical protein
MSPMRSALPLNRAKLSPPPTHQGKTGSTAAYKPAPSSDNNKENQPVNRGAGTSSRRANSRLNTAVTAGGAGGASTRGSSGGEVNPQPWTQNPKPETPIPSKSCLNNPGAARSFGNSWNRRELGAGLRIT